MPRVACLVVPRFAVAALRRSEPELRGCPVVVCDPGGRGRRVAAAAAPRPHARILEVSAEAARRGVSPGLTVVQALARSSDLVVRPLDGEAVAAAHAALVDLGTSISPRVEAESSADGHRGAIHLDVDGSERLFGSATGLMAALQQRAARLGLEAGVAIADGKATARIAAGLAARRDEAILVPPGGDAAWLAPLPLAALAPVAAKACAELAAAKRRGGPRRDWGEISGDLARLGIARIGELAALPIGEVVSRFGAPGARLWRVAAGADDAPLAPAPPPLELVEGSALEYGIESLEALLFVVRGLIDRLVGRLRLRGLACRRLTLSFGLDDGARVEREVGVLAPTCDVKTLVLLARSAIESAPPQAAIESVRATAVPDRARLDQLDLFRAPGPPPARLATALARLAALCGQERVGRPVAPAGHLPEAFEVSPFGVPDEAEHRADRRAAARGANGSAVAVRSDRDGAASSGDATGDAASRNGGSCNGGSGNDGSGSGASANGGSGADRRQSPLRDDLPIGSQLALRALRPPRPAEVFLEAGRIAYVRAPGLGGRALTAAGPWRIETEWWSDASCRRDYWEVQLSDGGVYRLFHDASRWWVDGVYD